MRKEITLTEEQQDQLLNITLDFTYDLDNKKALRQIIKDQHNWWRNTFFKDKDITIYRIDRYSPLTYRIIYYEHPNYHLPKDIFSNSNH